MPVANIRAYSCDRHELKCELAIQRVAYADATIRIIIFYALILLLFVGAHRRPCRQRGLVSIRYVNEISARKKSPSLASMVVNCEANENAGSNGITTHSPQK